MSDGEMADDMADIVQYFVSLIPPDDLPKFEKSLEGICACYEQAVFPSLVYPRNIPEIRLLPPVYDWEFTRRHPYYLQYQPLAAFHCAFAGIWTQDAIRPDFWGKAEKAAAILRGLGCLST